MASNSQINIKRVTAEKLRMAGVSSREIIAITGHITGDYRDIDDDDHRRLSKILSRSDGAMSVEEASQSSLCKTRVEMMTKQTIMLSTNPHPWPHMPFSMPYQLSTPVYKYFNFQLYHIQRYRAREQNIFYFISKQNLALNLLE